MTRAQMERLATTLMILAGGLLLCVVTWILLVPDSLDQSPRWFLLSIGLGTASALLFHLSGDRE